LKANDAIREKESYLIEKETTLSLLLYNLLNVFILVCRKYGEIFLIRIGLLESVWGIPVANLQRSIKIGQH